ncbi:hypothetical protein [Methylorubrum extorquens]|uniref:Uncharacterized protein n=1 Tax=Methylorubrum extorquens TaxID=408 RepID=A0AAX3WB72_METEX|nr:hypothetical protein [Methylorubrum extorquens]WHQ68641.1 hypothetical protein KEC54_20060 [Methylorubrum extorquens]
MSLAEHWTTAVTALTPYKEAIGGTSALLAAVVAGVWGVLKQRKRPDATFTEQAAYQPRAATVRLHPEDREALGDLREDLKDLTRAVRGHTGAVEDHGEVIARHGRRKPE